MPSDPTITPNRAARRWPAFALLLAFLSLTLPIILSGNLRGRGAGDQINFHEKTIRFLAADWPNFDFQDYSYLTATTPAYHLLLATAVHYGLDSTTALRLISCGISAGFILTLGLWLSRRLPPTQALAAGLPVICSLYVFQSGAWAVPDNTGWWGVLAILLIALRPRFDSRTLIWGGSFLLLLVLVRQIHIWSAAILWASAWMGANPDDTTEPPLLSDLPRRIPRTILAGLATLPAFAALAVFIHHWGALTPPAFQNYYPGLLASLKGGNILDKAPLAAPAYILSLLAIGSVFFAACFAQPLLAIVRTQPWAPALAALAGAAVAIIPATTYDKAGRWSGIWNAARKLPAIAGHTSPLILALSTLGALCLLGWCTALRQRERWIILAALAAFTAAQAASGQLWQRYSEPFILILLALLAALTAPTTPANPAPSPLLHRARTIGPLILAAILLAITLQKIATDKPVQPKRWNPSSTSTTPLE